jgi:large subunit ribosomal protein L2
MIIRHGILNSTKNYRKNKQSIIGNKTTKRTKLVYNLRRSYGRNNSGEITVRHKSRGVKRLYREINFSRNRYDEEGVVVSIDYDPNRNAFISLIRFEDKSIEYNLHIEGVKIGDKIISSKSKVPINPGNATCLVNIPQGTIISCISLIADKPCKISRAAGTYATVMEHFEDTCLIKLHKSGFILKIKHNCLATIGSISNSQFKNKILYKAGQKRYLGIRPTVRGVAMNPVDHPHGGGEGRGTTKRHPRSYTFKLAKGGKTAKLRSLKNKSIISRKYKKR